MSEKGCSDYCKVDIGRCVKTRRCFITGEYCSKQKDIDKAKKKLNDNNNINAFVIMNFSNMSDVAYEQRLKPFIECLKDYFYIAKNDKKDDKPKEIICVSDPGKTNPNDSWVKVDNINVVRADSSFASNYVICNRVCQQIQIADLIVVDVSVKNANVFYELGMAIAMEKLILPVCFSDSYFHKDKEAEDKCLKQKNNKKLHRHISCFPWRRQLFEYYGLRYKKSEDEEVAYLNVDKSGRWWPKLHDQNSNNTERTDKIVSDYFKFPYNEGDVGYHIYKLLKNSYNTAGYNDNTLLLYTLERFLNREQVGTCIINYYNYITTMVKELGCFCGDRIGTLAQINYFPEEDKDDTQKNLRQLPYSISDIIHLGVNQATYAVYRETVKPDDFLYLKNSNERGGSEDSSLRRFLKEYAGNRSMLIYPQNPVYVRRFVEYIQPEILKDDGISKFYCLYHIMLKNLKYVREVVVDISDASLDALFWLGMAHGADVYAITVQRQITDKERRQITGSTEHRERCIFDVSGLWCALFRSNDTQGFYRQLQSVNRNIEQQSQLLLPNINQHESDVLEILYRLPSEREYNENSGEKDLKKDSTTFENIIENIDDESKEVLESYYRSRFWRVMLKDNHVQVYVYEKNEEIAVGKGNNSGKNKVDLDLRVNISRWDFDTTAVLSRYLARRTPIGEYEIKKTTNSNDVSSDIIENFNTINLGANSEPYLFKNKPGRLSAYINNVLGLGVREFWDDSQKCNEDKMCDIKDNFKNYRGFVVKENDTYKEWWVTQHLYYKCNMRKPCIEKNYFTIYDNKSKIEDEPIYIEGIKLLTNCCEIGKNKPLQLGQLLLWREDKIENDKVIGRHFHVSLVGTSGPATKALASLLVSEPLKNTIFENDNQKRENRKLLVDLQETLRQRFIERFLSEFDNDGNLKLIADFVKLYLSTTLYRYFLPFITCENESRIVNGAEYFLRTLRMSDELDAEERKVLGVISKNNICDNNINKVISILKELLKNFRGVDALYQIEVNVKPNQKTDTAEKDNRVIVDIMPMSKNYVSSDSDDKKIEYHDDWLRCLFVDGIVTI